MPECVLCGEDKVHECTGKRTVNVGSYSLELDDTFMHCEACGENYHSAVQSKVFDELVIESRRRHEGLLSGADIRRIRNSLALSQAQLEDAMGIGPKTLVRWEKNLGVQSKAIDDVFRLIELDPDNLRFLVRIRQAAKASIIESKLGPEDHIKQGELTAAILDGLERANVSTDVDVLEVSGAIFAAIKDHKFQKMERLAEETRAVA
jgi:HTH-type transcriptional regulator/antitoxin MqsA